MDLGDGYYCSICKNKGMHYTQNGEELIAHICSCSKTRAVLRILRKSGLEGAIRTKTFDRFIVNEPWQQNIKDAAIAFTKEEEYRAFFIGGQSGCGKTHLCTAICSQFINEGKTTAYLLWTRDARQLKSKMSSPDFDEAIAPFANAQVLYIDDFLRVKPGTEPSGYDISLAFELLNSRLLDDSKITVISSELTINELIAIDEGTGSRICEMAGPYIQNVARDKSRNFRFV